MLLLALEQISCEQRFFWIAGGVSSTMTALAILLGGLWFLWSRVQYDLTCKFFSLEDSLIAEIEVIFENKGIIVIHLRNLDLELFKLGPEHRGDSTSGEFRFDKEIGKSKLVPSVGKSKLVPSDRNRRRRILRPNVRHAITHVVKLQEPGPLIQVTATFTLGLFGNKKRTIERVFSVSTDVSANAAPNHGTRPTPRHGTFHDS